MKILQDKCIIYSDLLQVKYVHIQMNGTNSTEPKLGLSAFGQNKNFTQPYGVFLNFIFRFIPIVIIICANVVIITAIRRTRAMRREMSWGSQGGGRRGRRDSGISSEQTRITLMLLVVTFVFLICTLPGAVNTIISRLYSGYSRLGNQRNLYLTVSIVTYFMETLNSSVNFVIYMVFSRRFFHTYQEIFCCRSSPWPSWQVSLRTVRFAAPPGGQGRSSSSPRCYHDHQNHPRPHRPTPHPLAIAATSSSSSQRPRYLPNGYSRSSFEIEDVKLINNHQSKRNSNQSCSNSCSSQNQCRKNSSSSQNNCPKNSCSSHNQYPKHSCSSQIQYPKHSCSNKNQCPKESCSSQNQCRKSSSQSQCRKNSCSSQSQCRKLSCSQSRSQSQSHSQSSESAAQQYS